jgi:uncharacterized oligopeptide transporter (OPT) family protein
LILVVRDPLAIGASAMMVVLPLLSVSVCAVMTGVIVESDSGNRRVRNSVELCLYIFEIWEVCLEAVVELVMELLNNCELVRLDAMPLPW